MFTLPFILLHLSTILTFALFVVITRTRNKKRLHYQAVGLNLVIFLWCLISLTEQYLVKYFDYHGMLFTNISFSVVGFMPVFLFTFGLNYAYSGSVLKFKDYYLFLVPIIGVILIWTNPYHHLYFSNYSEIDNSFVKGYYFVAQTVFGFIMDILGLFFLVKFSKINSGFFSKQSALILVGALFPFVVDMIFISGIIIFPLYYEPISFSIAVICFFVAIFKFGLFSIVPIALQTVVDHISDSYIVVNEKQIIIDYNKTFLDSFQNYVSVTRRVNFEELLKKLDQVSFVKYDGFMDSMRQAIETKRSISFENQYVSSSLEKTFTVEITPIYTQNLFKGTVILLKDITEQKKSFEMIKQTQVMLIESEHMASLGQLVGGIAHNLKTPIMSISGGLVGLGDLVDEYEESLGDEGITTEDHHEIAADMRQWIVKMKDYTAYMSDIISTVKGQAVQLTASTTDKFTLKELIKRVDILMNHELKRYGCKLNVQCGIDMNVEVKGEINSFVQVINNLIINGIEAYEGKEGIIEFIITRIENEHMIHFEVKDQASGMTDDVKNRLFKEMITTKAKNGTGLGLYMSHSTITGRFGGKMWFESVCGMGTSFYIMIPAV